MIEYIRDRNTPGKWRCCVSFVLSEIFYEWKRIGDQWNFCCFNRQRFADCRRSGNYFLTENLDLICAAGVVCIIYSFFRIFTAAGMLICLFSAARPQFHPGKGQFANMRNLCHSNGSGEYQKGQNQGTCGYKSGWFHCRRFYSNYAKFIIGLRKYSIKYEENVNNIAHSTVKS